VDRPDPRPASADGVSSRSPSASSLDEPGGPRPAENDDNREPGEETR
jgi:hypothetical protein